MTERQYTCANCCDTGWVCENHPDLPWEDAPNFCHCGAGMPCQECNKTDENTMPRMPGDWVTVFDKDGSRH